MWLCRRMVNAATPFSLALAMAMRVAFSVTTKPNPQWPSTTAVVGVSLITSKGAPGTMWPRSMRSQYSGMWMQPCESWPTRLALTWCAATISASSAGVPLAW